MKARVTLAIAVLVLALSADINLASAETMAHDSMVMQPATTQTTHNGVGVLKAVNAEAGKVQISHEAIASLNWPPMTMWFSLRTSLPRDMKAGDLVRFELVRNQNKWDISKIDRR